MLKVKLGKLIFDKRSACSRGLYRLKKNCGCFPCITAIIYWATLVVTPSVEPQMKHPNQNWSFWHGAMTFFEVLVWGRNSNVMFLALELFQYILVPVFSQLKRQ